jgi:hypothetical protein
MTVFSSRSRTHLYGGFDSRDRPVIQTQPIQMIEQTRAVRVTNHPVYTRNCIHFRTGSEPLVVAKQMQVV